MAQVDWRALVAPLNAEESEYVDDPRTTDNAWIESQVHVAARLAHTTRVRTACAS